MRLQALQSADGLSPLERGFERWHLALQPPVRTFEVIGFCCAATIVIRHLPFNWLGVIGDSIANLPSYLLAGRTRRHSIDQILAPPSRFRYPFRRGI
jgi:hypothetical protein